MASIAMLVSGALANALAFTGSCYLFLMLSKYSINKERKRYNLAIDQLEKAQVGWAQKSKKGSTSSISSSDWKGKLKPTSKN